LVAVVLEDAMLPAALAPSLRRPNAICASIDSGFGALLVARDSTHDESRVDLDSGTCHGPGSSTTR